MSDIDKEHIKNSQKKLMGSRTKLELLRHSIKQKPPLQKMRVSFLFVFFVGGMIVFDCVYAGKSSGYTVDYSGAEYYGIGGGNALFSWLFRSNNSAPRGLVIYSNGGPWCSSLMAALYEQGVCL